MVFALDVSHEITISCDKVELNGLLQIPKNARGIIIFAHGSGSGRLSPRNQYVAEMLHMEKFATLLFDLLTTDEETIDEITREYRFNIPFLATRLTSVTEWVKQNSDLKTFPIGYFGASTGGGAALLSAAQDINDVVKAVVSRGGRPDLAAPMLEHVRAATLLIVGGNDDVVIKLNQQALQQLTCVKKLEIIPGATHLFEEPGKLEEVARLSIEWFKRYLSPLR